MKRTILFSLMAAAGAMALTADKNAGGEEAAVRDAVARLNAAAREGDEAALNELIGEDLMYAHSNAKVENKAECVAALVKSKINFEMVDGWSVQVYGRSAMVHGKTIAHNAGGVQIPLHFMMMWVKEGNAWKLVGRHTAKLPA